MIGKIHFDMFYGLKKMSPIYTLKSLFSASRNNMWYANLLSLLIRTCESLPQHWTLHYLRRCQICLHIWDASFYSRLSQKRYLIELFNRLDTLKSFQTGLHCQDNLLGQDFKSVEYLSEHSYFSLTWELKWDVYWLTHGKSSSLMMMSLNLIIHVCTLVAL